MRVLIIEDDPTTAECIKRMLKLPEAETLIVHTMSAAAIAISEFAPDVAVVDLHLPDSAPLETVERVKEMRVNHPGMGTIVVTGAVDPSIANGSGADAVMHKLDMPNELRGHILKSISRHLQNPNARLKDSVARLKLTVDSILHGTPV